MVSTFWLVLLAAWVGSLAPQNVSCTKFYKKIISNISIFVFVIVDPELKVTLWMIIATVPKAGVSCAQSMLLACMAEVMPANKKIPYVFSVVTWARVWLLSAPFINVLKKIDVAMSLSAYCFLSIFGGICTCLMLTPRPPSPPVSQPTSNMAASNLGDKTRIQKNSSPLAKAVWTADTVDVSNTRL